MALVVNDRVKETSTTTGTGTINLAGAVSGFETFVTGIGNSNTTYYAIVNEDGAFEVGLGTITDATPDTLARTTIISSSNSDSAVNFGAGTKNVFCTLPASKAVILDGSGNATLGADLSVGDDLTVLGGVIEFKSNSGSPAALKMYCEVSNAHFQTLSPQPHSASAANTLLLPDSGDSGTQDLVAVNIAQTLTSKTLTSPVVNTGVSGSAFLDEDNMASNSATKFASQQSIKAYVDAQVATVPVGDITSVVAGTNLSGGGTSGDVTLNLADASTSAKGAASFSSDNFAASSGAITIKDAGVATAEIQDDAVTAAKIADNAVVTAGINADAVTQAKVADDAIGADQLAANAVVTASIVDDNVTQAKIADDAVGADQLAASAVVTASIVDDNVTQAKVADDAIGPDQLAADAVVTASIVDANVTTAKIADVNVTEGKIADNAVTLAKMASGTDGNIISYDASGNPVAIATGSSGQVLTSAGAGAQPSFQTPTVGDITSVVAGSGLTGGATSGAATLNVGAGTGIDVAADAISVDVSDFMANGSNNRVVTATGADAMNGEANMTFDGSTLVISGAITATGDITAFQSSDKNLKENISNIENAVDKVCKINGVYYNWTLEAQEKNDHFGKEKEVGVIAQDVEEVLPEIVATRDDGTKAVKYERLCALLIESIKELKKEIEELKSGA